ncbi:MAG: hypothetical protein OEY29_00390 [Gammaproteobacteria bacterium]|nr:hypothetical protein [Gammaproteobacteria bacterium]
MLHYYLMAVFIFMALGAFKIDGWISAILLILATLACSPVFELPSKKIKWLIVLILAVLAILLFPDIEQYREAFEQSVETAPIIRQD